MYNALLGTVLRNKMYGAVSRKESPKVQSGQKGNKDTWELLFLLLVGRAASELSFPWDQWLLYSDSIQ